MATATHYYEGMFILESGKYGSNPDAAASTVSGIIEKAGGSVVAHRPWQDSKLAYSINGHRKGLYYLAFFTAPSSAIDELTGIVKLKDDVIRHLVLTHDKNLFDQMVEHVGGEAFRHEGTSEESTEAKSAEAKPAEAKPAEAESAEPVAAAE